MFRINDHKKYMKKVALLFALSISALINADTLLHVGNLLDTNNGEISKAVTVRIKGNKILEVTKGYATPKKMMRLLT